VKYPAKSFELSILYLKTVINCRPVDTNAASIYTKNVKSGELLRLAGITKKFNNVEVLRGLDLCAAKGEFITLLGESGCGKTTTLRIIAGLESADKGQVYIDGKDVSTLDPDKRGVNMVFQNYALFPHMNVERNIGYSLKIRGTPKEKIKNEVADVLALVRLSGFEKRKPHELSGGQKQRVAVARAIINKPKVLLLDEPLGALDLQLRRQMQIELKKLQKQLGITFIYITHDQEEALTMSDRIAVMRAGVFEQIGTPGDIYSRPRTAFTASFVGGANVLSGTVKACDNFIDENGVEKINLEFAHTSGNGKIEIIKPDKHIKPDSVIRIAIREENIAFSRNGSGLAAIVTGKSFAGGLLRISAKLIPMYDDEEITASYQGIDSPLQIGDKITVSWNNAVLLEE
jgi:spermidine/putrescine transport system ATP-binding protein